MYLYGKNGKQKVYFLAWLWTWVLGCLDLQFRLQDLGLGLCLDSGLQGTWGVQCGVLLLDNFPDEGQEGAWTQAVTGTL